MPIILAVIASSQAAQAGEYGEWRRCASGEALRIAMEVGLGFTVFSAREVRIGRVAETCTGWVAHHLARGGRPAATFIGETGDHLEIAVEPRAASASFWAEGASPSWTGLYG